MFGTDLIEISFCVLYCYSGVVMCVLEIKLDIETEIVCRVSFLRTTLLFWHESIFHPWSHYCSCKDYNCCWCLEMVKVWKLRVLVLQKSHRILHHDIELNSQFACVWSCMLKYMTQEVTQLFSLCISVWLCSAAGIPTQHFSALLSQKSRNLHQNWGSPCSNVQKTLRQNVIQSW